MSLVWPAPMIYNLPPAFVTNIKQALIMEQKAQELRLKRLTHSPAKYILKSAIQPFKSLSSIRLHSFAVTRLLPITHPSTIDIGKFKSQMMQLCHKSAGLLLSMLKLEALRPFKEFHLNMSTNATLNWSIPSAVQHHIFETAQDYYQQATLSAIRTLRNASSARVYKTPSSLLPQLPTLYEMNARNLRSFTKSKSQDFLWGVFLWYSLSFANAAAQDAPWLLVLCCNWLWYRLTRLYRVFSCARVKIHLSFHRLRWKIYWHAKRLPRKTALTFWRARRGVVGRCRRRQTSARKCYWYIKALLIGAYCTLMRGVSLVVNRKWHYYGVFFYMAALVSLFADFTRACLDNVPVLIDHCIDFIRVCRSYIPVFAYLVCYYVAYIEILVMEHWIPALLECLSDLFLETLPLTVVPIVIVVGGMIVMLDVTIEAFMVDFDAKRRHEERLRA